MQCTPLTTSSRWFFSRITPEISIVSDPACDNLRLRLDTAMMAPMTLPGGRPVCAPSHLYGGRKRRGLPTEEPPKGACVYGRGPRAVLLLLSCGFLVIDGCSDRFSVGYDGQVRPS